MFRCKRNMTCAKLVRDTALHSGKDLAVSPFDFAQGFAARAYTKIQPLQAAVSLSKYGVSVRTSRLAAYRGYLLPILPTPRVGISNFSRHNGIPPKR
jgi:hypothetical protein